jgi:hypothetical protein
VPRQPQPKRDGASAVFTLLLGLAAAALLHGPGRPPVYDGIPLPVDPYRWESPPPNLAAGNSPPLSATVTLPVVNGQVAGASQGTDDNQIAIFVGRGTLKAPPGARTVTCTIAPDPKPPAPPPRVEIHGNVYRIGCVAQPGGAQVTVASGYHITLRFPPGAFSEIQYDDGTGWRPLPTRRGSAGTSYASVTASGFGEFAATAPVGASAPSESLVGVLGRYAEYFGILAFVIIFGVIAIV